jgi:hypothetical protein
MCFILIAYMFRSLLILWSTLKIVKGVTEICRCQEQKTCNSYVSVHFLVDAWMTSLVWSTIRTIPKTLLQCRHYAEVSHIALILVTEETLSSRHVSPLMWRWLLFKTDPRFVLQSSQSARLCTVAFRIFLCMDCSMYTNFCAPLFMHQLHKTRTKAQGILALTVLESMLLLNGYRASFHLG